MRETMNFSIGDVVEVIKESDKSAIKVGMRAKVIQEIHERLRTVGVEFVDNIIGHDCFGYAKDGHGWYISIDDIKKVSVTTVDGVTTESLYKTKWVELMKRTSEEDGTYIYIREPWLIDGQAVSILPYKHDEEEEVKFLVRCEKADVPVTGTVKGGCDKEGESTVETAVRELLEEAGYTATEEDMIELGTARSSKLNTTTMNLFAVDVTELPYQEPTGDGTLNESNAYCKWIGYKELIESQDPMVHASFLRLVSKLGILD